MDILIMKFLIEDSPKSGYDFITLFHEKFNIFISSGTVYSRLYSMERDGLIRGVRDSAHRVFELTEKGRQTINLILKSKQINSPLIEEIAKSIFPKSLSLTVNHQKPKSRPKRKLQTVTWALLSLEHNKVLRKIQLLEVALISLLHEVSLNTPTKKEKSRDNQLKIVKDFLKLFGHGVMQHFKIEEVALFPVLRRVAEPKLTAEQTVEMLLSEHKTINSKYFKLENIAKTSENPSKILSDLLKALSSHARKEEKLLPPLLRSLNEEQLKKIDEKTASLGYNV